MFSALGTLSRPAPFRRRVILVELFEPPRQS
jgi:hypothetical protein